MTEINYKINLNLDEYFINPYKYSPIKNIDNNFIFNENIELNEIIESITKMVLNNSINTTSMKKEYTFNTNHISFHKINSNNRFSVHSDELLVTRINTTLNLSINNNIFNMVNQIYYNGPVHHNHSKDLQGTR